MNIFSIATSHDTRSHITYQMHHSEIRENEYPFFRFPDIATKSRCRVIFHFHLTHSVLFLNFANFDSFALET